MTVSKSPAKIGVTLKEVCLHPSILFSIVVNAVHFVDNGAVKDTRIMQDQLH